uniref:Ovule protein n=1 Tax=Heterorhabditis bacteriophora TaxID=37862 RepID=A0A1I7W9H8_HETBA
MLISYFSLIKTPFMLFLLKITNFSPFKNGSPLNMFWHYLMKSAQIHLSCTIIIMGHTPKLNQPERTLEKIPLL